MKPFVFFGEGGLTKYVISLDIAMQIRCEYVKEVMCMQI